jgi:hypothetical protein
MSNNIIIYKLSSKMTDSRKPEIRTSQAGEKISSED